MSIKRLKNYFKTDLVDISAHYDSKLTYGENKAALTKISKPIVGAARQTYTGSDPAYLIYKAHQYHSNRKNMQRRIDNAKGARKTFNSNTLTPEQYQTWKQNSANFDITGVDSRNIKQTPKKQSADWEII